ncbi:MAG: hypothetical protein K0S07_658 [Chlamydiales bacterium]|jgi:hypothetical protein|nr:hypothetical protein [Chlamydiales bacterium]
MQPLHRNFPTWLKSQPQPSTQLSISYPLKRIWKQVLAAMANQRQRAAAAIACAAFTALNQAQSCFKLSTRIVLPLIGITAAAALAFLIYKACSFYLAKKKLAKELAEESEWNAFRERLLAFGRGMPPLREENIEEQMIIFCRELQGIIAEAETKPSIKASFQLSLLKNCQEIAAAQLLKFEQTADEPSKRLKLLSLQNTLQSLYSAINQRS